jgi:hypothetical protein
MTDSRNATKRPDACEYEWHSTPQLWSAVRPGYDGAPDANCPIGYGKTPMEAEADLIQQEIERE